MLFRSSNAQIFGYYIDLPTAGSGGGGGGGYDSGGGGTGILGQGSDGAAGTFGSPAGKGGSGGGNGSSGAANTVSGGLYGGGANVYPGVDHSDDCVPDFYYAGGSGAVRIMWPGNTRSFPSTNAGSP